MSFLPFGCKFFTNLPLITSLCDRIEVENTGLDGRFGDVSWTDKVYLTVAHHRVMLTSDYRTLINGTSAQLPLLMKPHLFIDRTTSHIVVTTGLGGCFVRFVESWKSLCETMDDVKWIGRSRFSEFV